MKIKLLPIMAISLFLFSNCKKEKSNPINIIESKAWKRALVDKNPSTNPVGSILYHPIQNCEKDDTFKFNDDGNLIVDKNADKCEPNEVQIETQKYTINRTTKELIINGTKYTLAEESDLQIKYYGTLPSGTGYNYVVFLLQ